MTSLKDRIPDDAQKYFLDRAAAFAADLAEPIMPCDAQESRMVKRIRLRQEFVDAYRAIKELAEQP